MTASLGDEVGPGLERPCGPAEWVAAARPLAETALEAGLADQAHFTRTFKAAFGMTPGRYMKLCSARSAHRLLGAEGGGRRDPRSLAACDGASTPVRGQQTL
jgi:hypothetical protein